MSALSLWERQKPGRNILGSFHITKEDKTQHQLSSCFSSFNNKDDKCFVCSSFELKRLGPPGYPMQVFGITFDLQAET